MNKAKKIFSIIFLILFSLICRAFIFLYESFILCYAWEIFITKITTLPAITIFQSMGIVMLCEFIFSILTRDKQLNDQREQIEAQISRHIPYYELERNKAQRESFIFTLFTEVLSETISIITTLSLFYFAFYIISLF